MSSANLVSLKLIKEAEYGVTPPLATAEAHAIRYTSESLSGTPQTTQSTEIRTDRMSSGQVVTGSDIGGDINTELSKDDTYDLLLSGAMMSDWVLGAETAVSVAVAMDGSNNQLYNLTGSGFSALNIKAGDMIALKGFVDPETKFNTVFMVTDTPNAPTDTEIWAYGPRGMGNSAQNATHLLQPDYLDIGSTIVSFTTMKAYQDVVHVGQEPDYHGQSYPGSLVNNLTTSASYGEIMTAVYAMMANGYNQDLASLEQQIGTAGGTLLPAGTSQPLNATIDSGLVTVDGEATEFCIESIEITLENNLTPQNCIGKIAPQKYNMGTAAVGVSASIYNSDPSYDAFMPKKWTQEPVSITFTAINMDGGYIFDLRAVQLSFPDPASTGENTQVMIEAEGVGKVGENGESSLRIWRVGPLGPSL